METETRFTRLIREGEKVKIKIPPTDVEVEEIVRSVQIVLSLANGTDVVLAGDSEIEVITDTFTEDLKAQAETLKPLEEARIPGSSAEE